MSSVIDPSYDTPKTLRTKSYRTFQLLQEQPQLHGRLLRPALPRAPRLRRPARPVLPTAVPPPARRAVVVVVRPFINHPPAVLRHHPHLLRE